MASLRIIHGAAAAAALTLLLLGGCPPADDESQPPASSSGTGGAAGSTASSGGQGGSAGSGGATGGGAVGGTGGGEPDPCLALAPLADPAATRLAIEACLAQGQAVLTAGLFALDQGLALPPGARLQGDSAATTKLRLQAGATNYLLSLSDGAEVSHLAADGNDQLPPNLNSAVIHLGGSGNHVHHCWLGNEQGVSVGTRVAGVYFIGESAANNLVELCEITGSFYGVIFRAGLPAGSANAVRDSVIHDNRCDGVTFAGYGELSGSELYHHGWDCENGPIPGAHVYSLNNAAGALIQGNVMSDSCGHGVDLDGVSGVQLLDNQVSGPGYRWQGAYPWCGGAAAVALIDSSDNVIEGNVVENNDRPHNAGSDPNHIFHAVSAPAFSDLPAGASQIIAFWLAQRPSSPGATRHNTVHANELRSACSAPCVGLGYYSSRGTGTDAGGSWSAATTSYYTANNPFGSNIGSRRCGANWYAANSTCPPSPTEPDCNQDDYQHTFDWLRNDDCRDY